MKRQRIKPSKGISQITFVVGILFTIFGVFMTVGSFLTPLPIATKIFPIVWTAIAIMNTYRAYVNGFTDKTMALYDIETIDNETEESFDFEEKLRKIERLKNEGLLTEEEYRKKREQIIEKQW